MARINDEEKYIVKETPHNNDTIVGNDSENGEKP